MKGNTNNNYLENLSNSEELINQINSLSEELETYKLNTNSNFSGISNLTKIETAIIPTAFSIDNKATILTIYSIDTNGNISIYTDSPNGINRFQRVSKNKELLTDNFTKIIVSTFSVSTILHGISNNKLFYEMASNIQDNSWKEIDINSGRDNSISDLTMGFNKITGSGVSFFVLKNGGIARQSGRFINETKYESPTIPILTNILFQAICIDNNNKIIYALDKSNEMKGNNLYMFNLNNDLDFIYHEEEVEYKKINSNYEIFFNNLILIPNNNINHVINSKELQFIFVGITLKNNEIIENNKINLYGGYLVYNKSGSPYLNINKLFYEDFSSEEFSNNNFDSDNLFHNLARKSTEIHNRTNLKNDPYKLINLDINNKTQELFILFQGILLKYPINNFNPQKLTKRFNSLVNIPLDNITTTIELLNEKKNAINNLKNKVNNKIKLERDNELKFVYDKINKEINNINLLTNDNKLLDADISNFNRQNSANFLKNILFILIISISFIIIVINFLNPNIIPTPILISYIVLIVIIIIFMRNLV